jgi:hypothetical protein
MAGAVVHDPVDGLGRPVGLDAHHLLHEPSERLDPGGLLDAVKQVGVVHVPGREVGGPRPLVLEGAGVEVQDPAGLLSKRRIAGKDPGAGGPNPNGGGGGPAGGGGGGGGAATSCQIRQFQNSGVFFQTPTAFDTSIQLAGCANSTWTISYFNTFNDTTDFAASGAVAGCFQRAWTGTRSNPRSTSRDPGAGVPASPRPG